MSESKPTTKKPAAKKATKKKQAQKTPKDLWELVLRNHERFIRLGSFGDIAQTPTISDVEIIVCFADIRGFTNYCHQLQKKSLDSRIQNFLRDYFKIFSISVLEEIWRLEPENQEEGLSHENALLRDLIVPVTYKNLGDGVMMVWEIPPNSENVVQGKATHRILDIIIQLFHRFDNRFRFPGPVEIDSYCENVKSLKMGIGLAKGHAWKLDFGQHLKFDYAGSIVNLAARLQDKARPEGILCQFDFSQTLFDYLVNKKGMGKYTTIEKIKGLDDQQAIILSGEEIRKIDQIITTQTGYNISFKDNEVDDQNKKDS